MESRINRSIDALLKRPFLYTVIFFVLSWAYQARTSGEELAALLENGRALTAVKVAVYALCALVLLLYVVRFGSGAIERRQPVLWLTALMFYYLLWVTWLNGGASGYAVAWHASFALMMALDMGLQRESGSVLTGLSNATSLWVYLNLAAILHAPPAAEALANAADASEWLLGSHVYYYRMVFPALAFEIMRAQTARGHWTARTGLLLLAVLATVYFQRGGTALLGMALFVLLLLFLNRRALPRYLTPMTVALLSFAGFAAIYCFDAQRYFAFIIERLLGKSLTLTYRTDIWRLAVPLIARRPVTGLGWLPLDYLRAYLGGEGHTHNQMLQLLLNGGLVALGIYFVMLWSVSREALRYRQAPAVKTAVILLSVFLFMGTVEIFQNDPLYYSMFLLLSRAGCLAQDVRLQPCVSLPGRIARDVKACLRFLWPRRRRRSTLTHEKGRFPCESGAERQT